MDKKLTDSDAKSKIASTDFKQKDWVKKLEALSGKPIAIPEPTRCVYLVIDCSTSMAERNKMNQAKSGSLGFSKEAQARGYIVGIIKFSSSPQHMLEPQGDLLEIRSCVESIAAKGSTNMADAIVMATTRFKDRVGEKVICVVTDGMPDDKTATLNAAKQAGIEGIDIMTVGTDDADKAFLDQLATRKGLSVKVPSDMLEQGIVSMAKLLPEKTP